MSNGNQHERLFKLWAAVGKMVLDGKRDPGVVAEVLQKYVIDPPVLAEKFEMLADLGIITVPNDYVHACQLAMFRERNREKFHSYNSNISDKNFQCPRRILHPRDKLHVRVFYQVVGGPTMTEEHMAFLKSQNAIYTGAQGLSLVFEQKGDRLPEGKWYVSFDEKEHLWKDVDGNYRVPHVYVPPNRSPDWLLGDFDGAWYDNHAFICFTEVED